MRVVHVGKFYPPEYVGGLESAVVGLNDELVRRGVGVVNVVAAVRGATRSDTWRGADVRRVRSLGTVLSQPVVPGFAAAVRQAAGDVLHLHHPNPLGDLAVLGDRRPLVITQHSDIVRQAALRPLYGPLLRRAFARARAITVASEPFLEWSREVRAFRDRARVIPYGIDAAPFAPTDAIRARAAALRQAWGGRPVVLGVGRLVAYKGFGVLIDAVRDLDATLVLVGSGPEEARLRARAGAGVVFVGRLSDADLVAHYHACDVFCLPSTSPAEAFGVVLLEAMACGKPLVSTALPTGISAVNRDGSTGLQVPPGDAGALREALAALLADGGRRAAMGEAARRVQAEEYSAALMGRRFMEVYDSVV